MEVLIRDLIEKRANAWEQAKALHETAHAESREFTAEETQTWERLNGEMNALGSRVKELEELHNAEQEMSEQRARFANVITAPEGRSGDGDLEERVRAFLRGESRALEFRLTGDAKRDVHNRLRVTEQRDLSKLTAGAGAATVPTGFVARLYEHLVEESAVRRTGAAVLTTDSGESLLVPKTTTHPTAALVAEAAALAESDPVFAQVTLGAFKYGVLVQVSSELITDTGVDLLGYLARQCGLALGRASGAHFVTGTGTAGGGGTQPEGVMTNITAGKTGATGQTTTVTTDDLIDLYHSLVSGYRTRGVWLTLDASLAKIRKLKDTTNQFLWQPGLTLGAPDLLLGRPVVTDPNVAAMAANAKSIAFGDFEAYYTIRDVSSLRFERSDDFAFANDLVSFRALIRTDGRVIDTTAVKSYVNSAT